MQGLPGQTVGRTVMHVNFIAVAWIIGRSHYRGEGRLVGPADATRSAA